MLFYVEEGDNLMLTELTPVATLVARLTPTNVAISLCVLAVCSRKVMIIVHFLLVTSISHSHGRPQGRKFAPPMEIGFKKQNFPENVKSAF